MKKSLAVGIAVAALCAEAAFGSGGGQEKVDFGVIEKIRAEGMERSVRWLRDSGIV